MNGPQQFGGTLSASWHLAGVSLRRLVLSRQTIICLLLLGLAALAVFAWGYRDERTPVEFIEDVLVTIYLSFLLPMFCLCFASAGISTDREEQTLVYLLTTPLPRPFIFAAKLAAALAISLAWTLSSLALLCYLAGPPGIATFNAIWPAVIATTFAYVALFQLFSVVFRRATIVALGYAVFLETLVANMPGIVKRLTISFYSRCLIFDAASDLGIGPTGPFDSLLFQPLPAATAQVLLYTGSGVLLLMGLVIFTTHEY